MGIQVGAVADESLRQKHFGGKARGGNRVVFQQLRALHQSGLDGHGSLISARRSLVPWFFGTQSRNAKMCSNQGTKEPKNVVRLLGPDPSVSQPGSALL